MQKIVEFLKSNGLSVFSLLAIIGLAAWAATKPGLPLIPAVSPDVSPITQITPLAFQSLNDQLAGVAKDLGLNTEVFSECLSSRKYQALVNASTQEGKTLGINGTPSSIVNGTLVVGAVPLSDLERPLDAQGGLLKPKTEGFAFLGKENAPSTIVEFGDYLCGYCQRYHDDILPQLRDKYINTGKVKFVFKDMVIFGENSQLIAEAARCAGDQGKFWEFHAKGFTLKSAD